MEQMIKALELLRGEYGFRGYIHAKTIPGADPLLVRRLGLLADRLSVNIELPSEQSLSLLAPDKKKPAILQPMKQVSSGIAQSKAELAVYRAAPRFAPAGQSTQMIVGASPESDFHILRLTEGLYKKFSLKRVFFSAYVPVAENALDVYKRQEYARVKDPGSYFYLKVKGDSMEPRISDGDLALVHRQSTLASGDLGVMVFGEGEGTLKKYVVRGSSVVLQPFNPDYPAQVIMGEDLDHLYIAGKVVETKAKW